MLLLIHPLVFICLDGINKYSTGESPDLVDSCAIYRKSNYIPDPGLLIPQQDYAAIIQEYKI